MKMHKDWCCQCVPCIYWACMCQSEFTVGWAGPRIFDVSLSHARTHAHIGVVLLCHGVSFTHTVSFADHCDLCQWDKVSRADHGSVSVKSLCLLVVPPPADSVGHPDCSAGWVRKRGSSTVSRWETPPSLSSNATNSSVPSAQGPRVLSGENLHFYWHNADYVTRMKVRLFLSISRLLFSLC